METEAKQGALLQAHMAAIVESSDDAILSKTLEGIITTWNLGAQRMFGYTPEEIVGRSVSLLFPPERLDEETEIVRRLAAGERVEHYETVRVTKDGRRLEVSLTVSPVRDAAGKIAGASKILRDITKHKRAEEALRESEGRFRLIADAIPQLMWTARPDGEVDYCNARWILYTRFHEQQTFGSGWKKALHLDDLKVMDPIWADALKTGVGYSTECRIRHGSDGTYRWFLMRGVAVRDSAGAIVKWIGTCTDIDDQKRAGEIEAARLEAETANRAKSEFLANMSHEIRTPMTAILGYADLLLDPHQTSSDRHTAVNVIRRNGAHLLSLINDILDLSKIEAGEMKVEQIACAPCQIIAEVTSMMRVRAKEAGLTFELKIESPIPQTIQTDPTRLRQILINLTGNAIKFTKSGWVRLTARLVDPPESTHPRMRFEVEDSGIGLTREQIGRLFQPFVQADNSTTRRFGGTGLGLTISQRLAHALGGEISVDSIPGRGSLFAVTLPAGPLTGVKMLGNCDEALSAIEQPAMAAAAPAIRLSGRVLLVEDGPDNQELLGIYLRNAGAHITVAENGRIACETVRETLEKSGIPGFDLILMDMQMPVLDGYGATAKLRSMGYRGPIVALTANAMATDRDKCLRAGCTDYLSKPVKRAELLETVSRHMTAPPASTPESAAPPPGSPPNSFEPDEVVRQLLPKFVAHLPQDVHLLLSHLAAGRLEELALLAHQIKGTAGTFMLGEVSAAAAALERDILQKAAADAVASRVASLVELIRAVQGYREAPEPA